MRRIFLMRHGATEWSGVRYAGRTDLPLTQAGRAQVAATAAHLRQRVDGSGTIVASPLRRARETADVVAAALQWEIRLDPDLQEIDFGQVEGIAFEELSARWPVIAAAVHTGIAGIDWPGGETSVGLHGRVGAAWTRLMNAPTDVLVVTHGGPIRIILDLALDGDAALPRPFLQPAQICVLERAGSWTVGVWP